MAFASKLQQKGIKVYVDHADEDEEGVSPEFLTENNVRFIMKLTYNEDSCNLLLTK